MRYNKLHNRRAHWFRQLERYLSICIIHSHAFILLYNTTLSHAHHKQTHVCPVVLVFRCQITIKPWVVLGQDGGNFYRLTNTFLSEYELAVVHDCLLGQKAHCWLPSAFKFNTVVVVREWTTYNKLVEVLDEVFYPHHEDSVVLVPLMGVTI